MENERDDHNCSLDGTDRRACESSRGHGYWSTFEVFVVRCTNRSTSGKARLQARYELPRAAHERTDRPREDSANIRQSIIHCKDDAGSKNFQYSTKAWQLRAIATIPGLVDLLAREDDLDVTWKQFHHDKKWLSVSSNLYYSEIEAFKTNSPKLKFCIRKAKELRTMPWKVEKDQAAVDVHEKVLTVGHNPVVCATVAKVCVCSNPLLSLVTLIYLRSSQYPC